MSDCEWRSLLSLSEEPRRPDDELAALCGRELGSGESRTAFEHIGRNDLIIKKQISPFCSDNLREWWIYRLLVGSKYQKSFGHIEELSSSGRFLVMERLVPLTHDELNSFRERLQNDGHPSRFDVQAGKDSMGTYKIWDYANTPIVFFDDRADDYNLLRGLYEEIFSESLNALSTDHRIHTIRQEASWLMERAKNLHMQARRLEDEQLSSKEAEHGGERFTVELDRE